MAKKSEKIEEVNVGTEAWNVADGYTKIKILNLLIKLDIYDTVAEFGTSEADEDQNFTDQELFKKRIDALKRFYSSLKQLISNTYFAVKTQDLPTIKEYKEKLNNIQEFLPKIAKYNTDMVSYNDEIEINENLFNYIHNLLREMKEDINKPLNNAGLIFRPTEEVDLDKIMQDIIQGG